MEKVQRSELSDGKTDFNLHKTFQVEDRSYLSLIKKYIKEISASIDLRIEEIGKLDIIATEITTNLIKHANAGQEILIKKVRSNNNFGVEIISIDKDPGISDVNRTLEDSYSTTGTKGEGLGAIKRLSDEFDIYSQVNKGTVIVSRVYKKIKSLNLSPKEKFEIKGLMVPIKGEEVCGDSWDYIQSGMQCSVMLVDGLGHGVHANTAARSAIEIYKGHFKDGPVSILSNVNEGIKRTRGAVGFSMNIEADKGTCAYCGVGNVSCRIYSYDQTKTLTSFNGILGHNVRRINNNTSEWDSKKIAVLHSDGLISRWDINLYPGIINRDLSILTAVLYRDYKRSNDDVSIVAIRSIK